MQASYLQLRVEGERCNCGFLVSSDQFLALPVLIGRAKEKPFLVGWCCGGSAAQPSMGSLPVPLTVVVAFGIACSF